ncbi:tyrosine-protein phosphatase [Ornithinibacillus halophilus]|uniref:Tyrosine-protein phosphatase n=1 Tax=Ornithinibacillus halophilus TaxID=930117 RepID=A0A1M5GHQ8_9BACI|nr:CpsB/CapC family capsule biosynthesis tyrosine phosphatase [Ornithinibacillus halophilus]SHG03041.1 protein-tyrosine phosphatase [Ornithinibacillus halophilus]
MIDIHSHILPGIDDGAKTLEDSLEMAREAVREGIDTIIATPHHRNGSFDNYKNDIQLHTKVLNEQLKKEGIPLTVLSGQETRIHGEMIEELESGIMDTLNGTDYVFVEFPSSSVPRYAKQMLFNLQVAGYKPIIVHPERNSRLLEHPSMLFEFVQKGALTQVTAASLIGKFGKKIQKFSHQLIDANLTHFLASDAHNTTSRGFVMQEAFGVLQKEHGAELFYLFMENAQLLVDGQMVNRFEPEPIKKKKILGLF